MRDTFVATLLKQARADKRVILVTGDLGFGVLNTFSRELPEQYLNAGIAEQNMTGVAAGMGLEGKIVFTYSIANFPTLRCLEQIRNDIAYHDANVKIVAVGGGFSYGSLGMSHHATEDLAILRAIPNVAVHAPCDDLEVRELTEMLVRQKGPAYLRLDKSKVDPGIGAAFEAGNLRCMRAGRRVAIIACGGIVADALTAAEGLMVEGIDCAVFSAHTLKPFDVASILRIATEYEAVVTIEEHVLSGGLGSLVAETLMDAAVIPRRFTRIALPDEHSSIVGSQEYLRERLRIDARAVAERVRILMKGSASG
jgi:transketolase